MNAVDSIALTERVQSIPAAQPFYTDDLMVSGIIVCGLILAMVMSDRKHFLSQLLKGFFLPRESAIENLRTTNVTYMRMGMYTVTFFSVGLLLAMLASEKSIDITDTYMMWLLGATASALFHLVRVLLFAMTDAIFLDKPTRLAWERNYANWAILSGIPLYLLTIIAVFFDLPPDTILTLLGTCIATLELCLLHKAFHIFSGKKYGFLQLFLYLCTLELIPLLIGGKTLVLLVL